MKQWSDIAMVTPPPTTPDCEPHTPHPKGYLADQEWADEMAAAGYVQRKCRGCGLWLIWEREMPAARHIDVSASPLYRQGMRKLGWLILWIVALAIGTAGAGVTGFIVVTLVLGVPYVLSSVLTPRTIHRSCAGRGYHRSRLFPWATRRCRGCVGGLQVRHGARFVGLPHIRAEHQRRVRTVARNRQDRTWR